MVIDEQRDQPLATDPVVLVEARWERTVEVEHARNRAGLDERNDEFGARGGIAGDVARELVDIGTNTAAARAAAMPQTPLPTGMRTQAGLP